MKKVIYCLSILATIGFVSCGDDDDEVDCDLMTFTQRADANLALGTTWNNNMTMANCEVYKADLDAIVSDYSDCDDEIISAQVNAFKIQSDSLDCQ